MIVERDRLGQTGASTGRPELVAELGRVERHAVAVEEHTVGAEAMLLYVRGEVVEHPLICRHDARARLGLGEVNAPADEPVACCH